MKKAASGVAITAAILGLAACVSAPHAGADGTDAEAARHAPPPRPPFHAREGGMHGERMAQMDAQLHDRLNLNPAQEDAWKEFSAAMAPPRRDAADGAVSAPERMQRQLERLKEEEKRMEGRLEATRKFYAVLMPGQRRVFDEELALRVGPPPGGRPGAQHEPPPPR